MMGNNCILHRPFALFPRVYSQSYVIPRGICCTSTGALLVVSSYLHDESIFNLKSKEEDGSAPILEKCIMGSRKKYISSRQHSN